MTTESYCQLAEALQHGPAVLAIVTEVRGSVPREVGAKMIIGVDGRTCNTIGGGAGEAIVIQRAQQVLETGQNQFVEIDLSGSPQRQVQGVCGGWMQVWLERWSGAAAIALVNQIVRLSQSGQSVNLVIPFAADQPPYLLEPSLPAPERAFVDRVQPPPTLLIVGAGHVGEQLAKLAHLVGFQIAVQDDRLDWANPQRYPQAAMILNQPIASAIEAVATLPELFIALVTRGYQYDLDALQAVLQRQIPCRYIGMIGSEKRVRTVYQALQQAGISADRLHSIHAPIGLEIGALTPAEIAVSIVAELIQVRRGGAGEPMSTPLRRRSTAAQAAHTRSGSLSETTQSAQPPMQQQP